MADSNEWGIALPEEWELVGFFEAEPILTYEHEPDLGWRYNELTFKTKRGEHAIECVLNPSYGEFAFTWSQAGEVRVQLKMCFAKRLTLHNESGREWMEVSFEDDKHLLPFRLQLKPHVMIEFGTTRWL